MTSTIRVRLRDPNKKRDIEAHNVMRKCDTVDELRLPMIHELRKGLRQSRPRES